MGALIIQEVVRELLGKGLSGAKVLLLAGSRWAGQGLGWESGYGRGGRDTPAGSRSVGCLPGSGSCPEGALDLSLRVTDTGDGSNPGG